MPETSRPGASRQGRQTQLAILTTALVAGVLAPAGPTRTSGRTAPTGPASATGIAVIVQQQLFGDGRPEAAVRRLGGTVGADLPIVGGFAAVVPAAGIAALELSPGVAAVSPDRAMAMQATPAAEPSGPRNVYRSVIGADSLRADGVTGAGVTVALIDTGVAEVPDLADRIVPVYDDGRRTWGRCVNLSGEKTCADSYGHGTFMAGLIAGTGASSGGEFAGVAPGARVLSIKVAGRDGSTDVSNVLAAIQWVVSFRDTYNIRVLNLSLGTDGRQSYRTDPLNYAVERAWAAGIVVVVSASNRGPGPGTIAKPADDPYVLTVGAVDDEGTVPASDDRLPNFSGRGPTAADGVAKPDLVAPGAHLVSLSAPGSEINARFPSSVDAAHRRGSGTSMSAAVVSGAAALYLQANPTASPDRVKYALTATARPVASDNVNDVGAGLVDVVAALDAPPGLANAGLGHSSGLGLLSLSRGSLRVRSTSTGLLGPLLGIVVQGQLTLQLLLWNPLAYVTQSWTPSSWYGSA